MGFKQKIMAKGRRSKNIEDIRDPLDAAKHNLKHTQSENARMNTKLRDKTPIAKQKDVYTDVVNYANNNVPGVVAAKARRAIQPNVTQVTPGKFEYKDNLGKKSRLKK